MEFLLEGIMSVTWQQILMYLVGFILIWLAIKKEYEPALLLPMGFGAILVNLPNTGVINQVLSGVGDTNGILEWLFHVGIEASEALPIWPWCRSSSRLPLNWLRRRRREPSIWSINRRLYRRRCELHFQLS